MENSGTIIWKHNEIGKVSKIVIDMWYLSADWLPIQSEQTSQFENIASNFKGDEVIKSPFKGIVGTLKYDNSPNSQKVLILSLEKSEIFMRMVSDELAAYADFNLLEPWQPVINPTFFENELKKELTFFHPMKWKKAKAIGNRKDCDDVLFEILNGKFKYAVVHLTYSKETSRKVPRTHFYKDWAELYRNCLLVDHIEWKQLDQSYT